MKKRSGLIIVFGLALILGGCAGEKEMMKDTAPQPQMQQDDKMMDTAPASGDMMKEPESQPQMQPDATMMDSSPANDSMT